MDTLHQKVESIISPIYMVGGCVRDSIRGVEPKDYDFATPLLPDEIEAAVKKAGLHAYCVGKRFGTIGCKVDGNYVEITTFRTEKYAEGNRKPSVEFVKDITADLSRRDFTINAIAKRGEKYIDPFGGEEDIKKKCIRCVGKPSDRFKEDPLRLLRAARFASQLGFTIDMDLYVIALQLNYKILEVSKERWMMELDKLLMSNLSSSGLAFIADTKLLNYIIPELSLQVEYNQNNPHHSHPLWFHTLDVVQGVPADINLRWAALLHDIAKPFVRTENKKGYSNYIKHDLLGADMVLKIARHLKWSNDRTEIVSNLVLNHMKDDSPLRKADGEAK